MKKRILALLLCLVMLVSILPTAAFAIGYSVVTVKIPVNKTVKVESGSPNPGEQNFTFQISGLTNVRAVEYDMGNLTISTNGQEITDGKKTFKGELTFTITGNPEDVMIALDGGFYVNEIDDGAEGWTYDTKSWYVKPVSYKQAVYSSGDVDFFYNYDMDKVNLTVGFDAPENADAYSREVTFTNTYNAPQQSFKVTVPVPFVKVVEVEGNGTAPKQSFRYKISDFAAPATEAMILSVQGTELETDGAGTYEGCLYLNLEMDSIYALGNLEEGFILTEISDGAENWTYDETAWYVRPDFDYPDSGSKIQIDYNFYPLTSDDESGDWYYEAGEDVAVFTNTYTAQGPVTFEFPYSKAVLQAGTQPSGNQSFTLELSEFGAPMEDMTVEGTTIETTGPDTYNGTIKITVPQNMVGNLSEGFLVTEKNTGLEGWTYSDAVWYCRLVETEDASDPTKTVWVPEVYNVTDGNDPLDSEPEETMLFINTFTKDIEIPEDPGTVSGRDYILHYESNGGTEYPDEVYAPNTMVPMTKYPFREGYTFTGWYLDAGLTIKITSVLMDSDKTVYAGWSRTPVPKYLNGDDHFAYVIGYEDGTTRPLNNITRAEVAMIFFRLLKLEYRIKYETDVNSFTDVNAGDWYCTAVSTLASMGILNGRSATSFAPNANITRAEFAAICARCDESVAAGVACFNDLDGHWAKAEVEKAAFLGWIKGYADGSFQPDKYITRAEAFTLINRVLQRIPGSVGDLLPEMAHWPDNADTSAWYYIAVQEATCSHEFQDKGDGHERWVRLVDNVF